MKLKYVLYMAAALSLTGCNDSFLERGPQNLNDQSFWVSVDDLKAYANAQGIEIIGDLPIYVAEDSVDVWSCPQEFQLDGDEFGVAASVHTWVDAGALTVMVPRA